VNTKTTGKFLSNKNSNIHYKPYREP